MELPEPELDFNLASEFFDPNNTSRNLFNFSMDEVYAIIGKEHKILDAYFLKALVAIYVVLMITGLFSNTMVWLVVARRAQMRTPRNFYVVNLTVSDISLCLISMPFTLVNFIETQWNLGLVLCKLVPVIQGCNIFVSTGTVMAIALDRYFTVVRSSGALQDKYRILLSIALIWIISCLFTFPILFYQVLEEESLGTVLVIRRCIEKWPSSSMRAAYTFGLLVFQLVIPILVLAGVHVAIANHLNAHTLNDRSGGGKSLLKKSFLQRASSSNVGHGKKNVFHQRLDESTVIVDDGKNIWRNENGDDNRNTNTTTLYNIPLNDRHDKEQEADEDDDDGENNSRTKCTVYRQGMQGELDHSIIPLQVYTANDNDCNKKKKRKIECHNQVERTISGNSCSTIAAATSAAASEISSTVAAVATVGNNVSKTKKLENFDLDSILPDSNFTGRYCNGNGNGNGNGNCSSNGNGNGNGNSSDGETVSNSIRPSPLNVKFKSNIGVCITFREFCQLSTRRKGGVNSSSSNSASASASASSSLEQEQEKIKGKKKHVQSINNEENNLPNQKFSNDKKKGTGDKKPKSKTCDGNHDQVDDTITMETELVDNQNQNQDQEEESSAMTVEMVDSSHNDDDETTLTSKTKAQIQLANNKNNSNSNSNSSIKNNCQQFDTCVKNQLTSLPLTLTPSSIIPMTNSMSKRTKKELARNRRTTILLLSVAVIFTISWMPWHLLTLWADLHPNFTSTSNLYMFFAIAHILAMTSAVTNAILYGWFNTNLRRELLQMLSGWIKR